LFSNSGFKYIISCRYSSNKNILKNYRVLLLLFSGFCILFASINPSYSPSGKIIPDLGLYFKDP
jgi:hypothetical protein